MQEERAAETQKEIKKERKEENHFSESEQLQLTLKNQIIASVRPIAENCFNSKVTFLLSISLGINS
jgi:hypothetical protein